MFFARVFTHSKFLTGVFQAWTLCTTPSSTVATSMTGVVALACLFYRLGRFSELPQRKHLETHSHTHLAFPSQNQEENVQPSFGFGLFSQSPVDDSVWMRTVKPPVICDDDSQLYMVPVHTAIRSCRDSHIAVVDIACLDCDMAFQRIVVIVVD